jgi:periplasmic protein TonB
MQVFVKIVLTVSSITMLSIMMLTTVPAYASDRVYAVSDLQVVNQAAPRYPRAAAQSGMEGWVDLEFTVTVDGTVSDAEVVDSSSRIFHRDALIAIGNWEFEPVNNGNGPEPVRAALRFTFQGN